MGPLTTRHFVSLPRLPLALPRPSYIPRQIISQPCLPLPFPRLKYYPRHLVSLPRLPQALLGYNGRSPLPTSRAAGVTLSRPRVG